MARNLLLFFALLIAGGTVTAQTSLAGKVLDDTGEPVIFGSVVAYKGGVFNGGTETDFDGNYSFSDIDPGTYDIEVSYVGFSPQRINGVTVFAGKVNKLDVTMSAGINLTEIVVTDYKVPLIQQDNTTQGATITSDQIKNLPTRNINALAANTAGLASADEGDNVGVRGSRDNATDYYIDGIRVRGTSNLIPESEIDQLQVITGGIEAQYGDVTGGIISITTKGPSQKFSGGVEVETSSFTDPYDQSLFGFNLSGPILQKTLEDGNKQSILGFRLSGRLTDQLDDDPPATNIYKIKDDRLAILEANPVIEVGGTPFAASDFLTNDDVEILDYKPNEEFQRYDFNAKLDARLSEAIDISLTGSYSDQNDQITSGRDSRTLSNWRVLNSHNNPTDEDTYYRGNLRFRHRLGGSGNSGDDQAGKVSLIQNASYTLQFGYENNQYLQQDPRHQDRFFDYGYIGEFQQEWRPSWDINFEADSMGVNIFAIHEDYSQVLTGYNPDPNINPVLANYNNIFLSEEGEDNLPNQVSSFNAFNGDVLNIFETSWGFHGNVGTVYNRYRERNRDTYTFSARTAFDLVPGGDKGRHNIQLGVWYEQRTDREYTLNPRALWVLARQLANNHIQGIPVDEDGIPTSDSLTTVPVVDPFTQAPIFNPFTGEQLQGTIYALDIAPSSESQFYSSIRDLTGDPLNQFVNVDALRPDQLSLNMFSSRELNDFTSGGFQILDYYGYDYLGNFYDGNFDDYFTATDPNTGLRTFPVAPNRPIYGAAFVQDKFTFKDIIFRLGVRVDRYDANTRVLKDNYSLYEIINASDYHGEFGGDRPGNIGDEYKVYAKDDTGSEVLAYRNGDQWFEANGNPVNNAALIFQGGVVNPVYSSELPRGNANYVKEIGFDPDVSFEDYEVQVNVMPRLAFSFPISDEANFFAHYDILVQRPPSNTIATAQDYYYFYDRTNIVKDNPNLRPERTVDYEVGFQQKLSNSSALKISAYYKELRDMIQRRTFFPVPVIGQYTTYDNQDFGTVKGFSFQYDLRRTGNITVNANYTLQFADGTGSDANSQRGLTSRGNLRTLFPLNFDERHRVVATIDYRYGAGKTYNGPRVGGVDILSKFGVNLQTIAVSGRPYTAKLQPNQPLESAGTVGSLNGARKPWNFTLNLRVDKNFKLSERFGLNLYCRVSNLLDQRNTIDVYEATGSPDDDGYLNSTAGVGQLQSIDSSLRELNSYLASYQWRVLNPNFFSLPRRIYLGAIFDF